MAPTKRLSVTEKAQTNVLHSSNLSYSEIAYQRRKKPSTITRFLVREKHEKQKKLRASNKKLSNRVQKQTVSAALRKQG